jgi:hypothetical protein
MAMKTGGIPIKPKTTRKRIIPKKKIGEREDFEQTLLDNFVSLQKVLTNLAVKFDSLSDQMSKLLELFEISAKSFAEKSSKTDIDGESFDKLDTLLEQNKTIARGIMLIEEKMRNKIVPTNQRPAEITMSRPLPKVNQF